MLSPISGPIRAFRGALFHLTDDPFFASEKRCAHLYEDGLLVVQNGRVVAGGPASSLLPELPAGVTPESFPNAVIVPGFIDVHVHYPQLEVIASYGEELLDWLKRYSFPAEARFGDEPYAALVARRFLDELLRNGTTSALVFGTSHPVSVEAFFREAQSRGVRMIAGKVLMDRNAPRALRDTAATGYRDSRNLIERWHGKGRLEYAVTPRFAITSTSAQLEAAARLLEEFPSVRLHTHLAENRAEIAQVRKLFPRRKGYLDVYDHYGLVGPRSIFAHCLHLRDTEIRRLAKAGAAAAFCPTSNLFLGSGLFPLARFTSPRARVKVGLGTDVGAGTSLSLLATMNEAYKVARLQGERVSAAKAYYLATLGGARVLGLEERIGNFLPGKEADFTVLDLAPTPLVAQRIERAQTLEEKLFVLALLGDERAVRATYVMGRPAYLRQ